MCEYKGPINTGMRFLWHRDNIIVQVMGIWPGVASQQHEKEFIIHTKPVSFNGQVIEGVDYWSEESRFREAVSFLC